MKKIILAFDGHHFSDGAFEFARRLNKLSPVLLTGVFLPQAQLSSLWSHSSAVASPLMTVLESDDSLIVQENIDRFTTLCEQNGIEYRIHKDFFDFVLPELKRESGFADLIILGSETFYENITIRDSNLYLEQALNDVACPVILVPEKFDFPESIILAYDGKQESIFSIKQFAYLFPEFNKLPCMMVYAAGEDETEIPNKIMIEELVAYHFKNLEICKLDISSRKDFSAWLSEKKSSILVSGSFGRSGLSQLFKRSFIKEVIGNHRLPIFVAHR